MIVVFIVIGVTVLGSLLIIAWSLARVASKVPPIPTVNINKEEAIK